MKRKKTRKEIELVILIILLLSCAAIFINNYLVPAKLKNFTRNFLTTALNKPVFFENISFSLIKGVTINNITIFKTSEQKDTFLKAKSISFSPLLLPVIKKKFIISRLLINELALNLERMSDGKLDILDMPPSPDKENKEESFPVIITDITLKNSNITFTDNFLSAPQVIYLENISANAYFSLPAKVKFNFKTSVKDRADEISLKGNYYLQDKHLALTLNCIDLNLHQFNDYFKDKFPISIAKDTTDIAADIFFDIGKTLLVDGTIYFNDSQTNFISLALDGDFVIRGKLIYDFINKTLSEANGNIVLRKNNLKGLLYVDALEEIEGVVDFKKDGLFIQDLTAKTKTIPLNITGYLKNFHYPEIKIGITSNLKLDQTLKQLPPQFKEKLKNVEIQGETLLEFVWEGPLKKFWSTDFSGHAKLTDVIIKSASPRIELKNIDSKISFTREQLTVDNLNVELKGVLYSLTASLTGFQEPVLDFKLNSDNLFTKGKIKISPQLAQFEKISGAYKGIGFESTGQIQNFKDPELKIDTQLTSSVYNLKNNFPEFKKLADKLKLEGSIDSSVYFDGKAADVEKGLTKITASSPNFNIAGFQLNNLKLTCQLQQKILSVNELSADAYNGYILSNGSIDIKDTKQPKFQTDVNIQDIDLSKFIKDTNSKDKKIRGIVSSQASLMGISSDVKTFSGSGKINVTNAYFFDAPAFNSIFALLIDFLKLPDLKNLVFEQGSATYQIKDSYMSTQDLNLKSKDVTLSANGKLGFDKSLDFLIETQFSQEYYDTLNANKKTDIPSLLIDGILKYAIGIRLGGTTSHPEPKPEFKVDLKNILKELEDSDAFKNIKDIFKNF